MRKQKASRGVNLIQRSDKQLERIIEGLKRSRQPADIGETCPDDNLLANFLTGSLPDAVAAWLESHLAGCFLCLDIFTAAALALDNADLENAPQSLVESAKTLVLSRSPDSSILDLVVGFVGDALELISTSMQVVSLPAAGVVRGKRHSSKPHGVRVKKELDKVSLFFEVEPIHGGLCQLSVTVKNGEETAPGAVRLSLISKGREQASFFAPQGTATFDRLPPGEYQLAVVQTRRPLVLMRLTIKEEPNGR